MDSDSCSDSDVELQEALYRGDLKPGLNVVKQPPKTFANNVNGMKQKLSEIKLDLPWIETLHCTTTEAPLAPELAAQLLKQEQKRESELKNNKKLPQFAASDDPVLNDFKKEVMFHNQAQGAVMEAVPRLKALGIPTKRPEDYFAEMAKTDDQMQKIRQHLMTKEARERQSQKIRELRHQRKEGKMLQIQTKMQQQKEKKDVLDKVKKVRKGLSKDLDFLDKGKGISRKHLEKRKMKDKKFGFGGKKRGSKQNTKDSAAEIGEYRRPNNNKLKKGNNGKLKNQRPGKNKRMKNKNRKK